MSAQCGVHKEAGHVLPAHLHKELAETVFRSVGKPVRLFIMLTICLVWQSGCANLRLPAIDPYGRRIFLPRPASTTIDNTGLRLRDRQLFPNWPRPAFTQPDSPVPPCNLGQRPSIPPFSLPPRRRPLLDCLFGPEQDESCYATPCQTNTCNLPIASCTPVLDTCYDPCYDPCLDPCLDKSVILGQTPQSFAPLGVPNYAAPAITNQPPSVALPVNRGTAYATAQGTRGVYAARLQLDPQRLVAPVGSEVVLRAGLCGDDGYLITKQPIEWSLSQDSVGSIVEVDEFAKPFWRRMLQRPPTKKSGDYAIGRTSTAPQVLTRGTLDTSDDIWLAEGQTWVSITSAAEGASHVSAVAPSAAGWGERRQLATVTWIDGRWLFPQPAFAPAGTNREITTNVRRSTTGAPIPGWIVRYEISDTTSSGLAGGQRTLDVLTDELGNATVNVTPLNNQPGVTQVGIQVIRVGNQGGDLDRVVVGQGTTSITWTDSQSTDPYVPVEPSEPSGQISSGPANEPPSLPDTTPTLGVRVSGPASVEPNQEATYRIDIENRNATPARSAELLLAIPYGMQYVNSQPAGNVFDDHVRWPLSDVPPQQAGSYQVRLRAAGPGPFRVCARARVQNVAAGEDCVDTTVTEPSIPDTPTPADPYAKRLEVRIEGPETAQVGDIVPFEVFVTNLSSDPLPRVLLRDDFDSGFGHSQGGSPIEWAISLAPNETRPLPLRFTATTPGQQCHALTVTSGDGSRDTARACVNVGATGSQGPPSNDSGSVGPDPFPQSRQVEIDYRTLRNGTIATSFRIGEIARIQFVVRNTGQTPLTNLQIVDQYNPILFPVEASPGHDHQDNLNRLVWSVDRIDPGQSSQLFEIDARCERPSAAACHTLSVLANGQTIRSGEACLQIDLAPAGTQGVAPPAVETHRTRLALSPQPPTSMQLTTATDMYSQKMARPHFGDHANDNLRVTVSDLGDPALVNQRLTYVVMVRNLRRTSDRNVVLTITLPAGARFETSINPPMIRACNTTPDRRTVEFLPIAELRGSESATFRIVAASERTGTGTFRAEITSARSRLPVVVTEETTFFAE